MRILLLLALLLPQMAYAGLAPIAVPSGTTIRFLQSGMQTAGVCSTSGSGVASIIAPGSSGNVLTSNGSTWSSQAPGIAPATTNTVSSNFTIPTLMNAYILNVNTTAGAIAITLPDAVASSGFCVKVKNTGSPVHNATQTPPGIQTVDALASDALSTQNSSHQYCAVSGNWFIY